MKRATLKFEKVVLVLLLTLSVYSCKKNTMQDADVISTESKHELNARIEPAGTLGINSIDSYIGTLNYSGNIKTLSFNHTGPRTSDYYGEIKTTTSAVGSDGRTYQFSCTHMFTSSYNGRHSPAFTWKILANFGVYNGGSLQYLPFSFQLVPTTASEVYFIQNMNYPSSSCNESQLTYNTHTLNSGYGNYSSHVNCTKRRRIGWQCYSNVH